MLTSTAFVVFLSAAWRNQQFNNMTVSENMNSKKISVGYYRYSSEAQRDSTSIDVQREQCEHAAEQSLAAYVDEAKTGRALAGRENLHRLLADAAQGKIEKVYVYRYDRLGRNESDTFGVVDELESVGVEVVSATEGRDSLTRGVMLVMSAHYSRELAVKTRNGLLKRGGGSSRSSASGTE